MALLETLMIEVGTSVAKSILKVWLKDSDMAFDASASIIDALIRTLATSPLLCAMLCALNRERREQLPSDRIKLYEACCEMLIERRDRERRVSLTDYPAASLSYREKLVLLEDLSYWLIQNGWSQIELQRADERFARKLTNMHNISPQISSVDVRRLFVERTSMLREPIAGHIDFTHRTFQEFLAARAALDEGDIGVLVKNAHDDQWREVIILASGLAPRKVREELMQVLIERGDTEKVHRYQLHLLAVSCLATSVELGQEIKTKVRKRLSALVPPKNIADARAIAEAGELAVPYLVKDQNYHAATIAACIRALSLIGGDAALKAIESYARDTRSTVESELLKAWSAFDRKDFARRVLYPHVGVTHHLDLERQSSVDGVQFLTNLTRLSLSGCPQLSDLAPLAGLTNLTSLDLSDCPQLSDLAPLAGLTNLTSLDLSDCPRLSDLAPLAGLTNLTSLGLSGCPRLSDLAPLAGLMNLTRLSLYDCPQLSDLAPLAGLTNLTRINLYGCPRLSDLTPLAEQLQQHIHALITPPHMKVPQKQAYLILLSSGQSIPLTWEVMLVGRQVAKTGDHPEINLLDMQVGRRHAYLRNRQGTFTVEDLNSTNKTRLNGVTLTPHQEYPLKDGDLLRFGSVDVRFELQ